ncbi:hypothetical protein [Treponema sp.]|uniref:hypothetical protein n=1 Tax=Treponema sp. TaxID=166 RepID=UPI00298E22E4|nr:hypothetical protein [Treponema sp.]MCQ2240134.1 hypothetical protein [Treponema sp.]
MSGEIEYYVLDDSEKFVKKLRSYKLGFGSIIDVMKSQSGSVFDMVSKAITEFCRTDTIRLPLFTVFGFEIGAKYEEKRGGSAAAKKSLLAGAPGIIAGLGLAAIGIAYKRHEAKIQIKDNIDYFASAVTAFAFNPSINYMILNSSDSMEIEKELEKILVNDWGYNENYISHYIDYCKKIAPEDLYKEILNLKEIMKIEGLDSNSISFNSELIRLGERVLRDLFDKYPYSKSSNEKESVINFCLGKRRIDLLNIADYDIDSKTIEKMILFSEISNDFFVKINEFEENFSMVKEDIENLQLLSCKEIELAIKSTKNLADTWEQNKLKFEESEV